MLVVWNNVAVRLLPQKEAAYKIMMALGLRVHVNSLNLLKYLIICFPLSMQNTVIGHTSILCVLTHFNTSIFLTLILWYVYVESS